MRVPVPEVRVGAAAQCGGLSVFPLFSDNTSRLDYLLSEEAMSQGMVVVREVSAAGSVGELLVDNGGDRPVLFMEGEGLRGAKQDRVVRSTILVARRSRTTIPAVCVERRRWRYDSLRFRPNSHCPPTLRHLLKQAAHSAMPGIGQAAVWRDIRRRHGATQTSSTTESLSHTLDTHRQTVEDLRRCLPSPEGASGVTIAIGRKIVSVDLLDKPATLAKIWSRFVEGIALDALEIGDKECQATGTSVAARLYGAGEMRWLQTDSVGLGERYLAQDDGMLATALVVDGTLLHLSVSMPFTK